MNSLLYHLSLAHELEKFSCFLCLHLIPAKGNIVIETGFSWVSMEEALSPDFHTPSTGILSFCSLIRSQLSHMPNGFREVWLTGSHLPFVP